jgi:Cu-Zn family superoxide dismutase
MTRAALSFVIVIVFAVGAAVGTMQPAAVRPIELPASVSFPEGIAYDASAGALYTAGAADGVLARIDAKSGAAQVVARAGILVPPGTTAFPAALGMKIDPRGRLWIAGGRTGKLWVVESATGRVVKEQAVPTVGRSLLNDVALVGPAAYVTDTFVPTLWRVSMKGDAVGELEPWLDLSSGPIKYGEAANLNGIAPTPDGRRLIVVHMSQGTLFTVGVESKAIAPIDTAGEDLSGADGLVLDGDTLYVVRQTAAEVVTVRLDAALTRGTVVSRFKDPALTWPATAVRVGADLVVVNTQFNTRESKSTRRPFTLLRVPVSRLGGR